MPLNCPTANKIKANSPCGFTLLELLLVCAILIVMGATVSASMGGMINRSRLRGITARVSSQAIFARSHALTSGQKVVMTIDRQAGEITLSQAAQEGEAPTPLDESWQVHLPQGIAIEVLEIDGETVDQGQISFYPEGGAQAALIVLAAEDEGRDARREAYRLEINKITGRMTVRQ